MRHLTQLLQQEITLHKHTEVQRDAQKMLLKEIHHRVKNNMTMAISFIQLQIGQFHDQRDLALFQELEHRIYTMALIHEKLYTSQDASSINLRIFLTDLSQTLLSSWPQNSSWYGITTLYPVPARIASPSWKRWSRLSGLASGGGLSAGLLGSAEERSSAAAG